MCVIRRAGRVGGVNGAAAVHEMRGGEGRCVFCVGQERQAVRVRVLWRCLNGVYCVFVWPHFCLGWLVPGVVTLFARRQGNEIASMLTCKKWKDVTCIGGLWE